MPILDVIPQIYYDILGRIVPGLVALWLWMVATGLTVNEALDHVIGVKGPLSESVFIGVSVALVAAYVLGHLMSPISAVVHSKILARRFSSSFSILQRAASGSDRSYPPAISAFYLDETRKLFELDKAPADAPSASQYRQATYIWYDKVRLANEATSARLGKMRAEYRMLEGLYTAFALTLPIQLIALALGPSRFNVILMGVAIIGFGISCWSAVRLFATFQRAVINEYYIVQSANLA